MLFTSIVQPTKQPNELRAEFGFQNHKGLRADKFCLKIVHCFSFTFRHNFTSVSHKKYSLYKKFQLNLSNN